MFDELLQCLTEMPDAALDDRIRDLELQRRRLDAEMAAAVAVAEHRRLGAADGHRTVNSYLRATLNCSSSEASRLCSLGRAVDRIDGLGSEWFAGRFGCSQAVRFAGVVGNRRVRGRLPAPKGSAEPAIRWSTSWSTTPPGHVCSPRRVWRRT